MSLPLSRVHGVAPALTVCKVCGADGQDLLLLGAFCDSTMRKVHEATDGQYGSKQGYKNYGHNKVPHGLCKTCEDVLKGQGCIIIAKDTQEFLRLDKDQVDSLVGRVGDGERFIDFDSMRGKIFRMPKAFWYQDGDNIRLRDPKEWIV